MGESEKLIKCSNEIIKSGEDKRCYRGLELGNKLKVLLISDSDTDKASAAINVNVGYLSDPDNLPGLAHFCEHMLFLGTEKYPVENDYFKFISEHGGHSNASTKSDSTTYYFDVLPEHFEGALDRFAQFFLDPLFTESATEREINAVHSEFEKNIPSDAWRFSYLEKYTSKEGHPYTKFGSGNYKTLYTIPKEKGINIRNELMKFHQTWYSSNLMTLAVLGKQSLDDLEKIVTSLFLTVKNKDTESPEWNEHPFGPEQLQTKIYVVPIKNIKNICITFPTPDLHKYYKSSPFAYISHLIGHEGPGSLLSALKARGWCNNLECGYQSGAKGFAFFIIRADLTDDGIDHADDIVKLVFQYINILKKEGPKKWIFDECQQILKTIFRFKEKESPSLYASAIATRLLYYPIDEVLCGPYFIEEWRPDLIESCLEYLQPKYIRVKIIAQRFENITNQTEPWFGTKYKLEKIPDSTIKEWEDCGFCDDLKLRTPNTFITSNYDILPREEKALTIHPTIILNSPTTRVWFVQDNEFLLPQANLKFDFICPLAYLDPLSHSMTHLFVQILKDSLNEFAYDAQVAGLTWYLSASEYGMTLGIGGYNDKQGILLDYILERMTNLKIDPKRFEILKDLYERNLKNFDADQPYLQASYYLFLILNENAWTKEEILKSLEYLTLERLEQFIPQLLSKFYVECLFHGNINKEKAFKLVEIIDNRLTSSTSLLPILPRHLMKYREIQLLDGSNFMYEVSNDYFSSSCVQSYYQCGLLSTENNTLMELLAQIMIDPCFDVLRTKEQLGYIVFSGIKRSHCIDGLRVIIQSDKHPYYLNQRIEAFLIHFREMLEKMSLEEFESHRASLVKLKLEKPKKLTALTKRFWDEISSQIYYFNRQEEEAEHLKTITKSQLLEFFDKYIKYEGPNRRKLSVHVLAKGEGGAGNEPEPDLKSLSSSADGFTKPPPFVPATKIEDIIKFKTIHPLCPLGKPHINIPNATTKSKL